MLDTSDSTWQQVQLSLHYVQELWLVVHSSVIATLCSSSFGDRDSQYLVQAITLFNSQVIL